MRGGLVSSVVLAARTTLLSLPACTWLSTALHPHTKSPASNSHVQRRPAVALQRNALQSPNVHAVYDVSYFCLAEKEEKKESTLDEERRCSV